MKTNKLLYLISLLLFTIFACKRNESVETIEPEIIYPEFPPPGPDPSCVGDCPLQDYHNIDDEAAWSANGKWIAYFHRDLNFAKIGIYIISTDGRETKFIHNVYEVSGLTWSADGKWICFSYGAQIWNKNIETKEIVQLTNIGRNFDPKISPDGQSIAYRRSYASPEPIDVMGIWRMKIDGSNREQLFKGNSGYPLWKENEINFLRGVVTSTGAITGDSLFFYNEIAREAESKFFIALDISYARYSVSNNGYIYTSQSVGLKPELWFVKTDGSDKRLIKPQAYMGDWSPDGKQIVYTDTRRINGRLWIMDADGTNSKQLTFATSF